MAGVILVAMGAFRLGRLIEFVPHPVTTGFTAGIAVVIATLQVKDFLGLRVEATPENYVGRVAALFHALPTLDPRDASVGVGTLATLLAWAQMTKKGPGPRVALTLAGIVPWVGKPWFGRTEKR